MDDRGEGGVIGADKKPLSWFCHIYADALSDDELLVRLWNMPSSKKIDKWLEKNEAKRKNMQGVGIMINRGKQGLLTELSSMMRAIVAPDARYEVNYFKYSCPRVAKSLDKLKAALDVAWTPGSKGGPKAGPFLFADEDYRERMNVDLTPDQRALVKRAIDSGRFSHEEEAVQEALALWEERESRRLKILASLDEAEASLARGEGRPITEESTKVLADDVKQRGRTRLAAERNASH